MSCTCNEKTLNANVNVKTPQTNVSHTGFHFEVEELNYGPVSLKGLKGNFGSTITDENVRIQADFVGKLFQQMITKFGDAIVDNIRSNTERQRQRIKEADREFEAEHKYDQENHEADMKYKEEQTRYYASQAKYYNEQAETEKSRRIREEQKSNKNSN